MIGIEIDFRTFLLFVFTYCVSVCANMCMSILLPGMVDNVDEGTVYLIIKLSEGVKVHILPLLYVTPENWETESQNICANTAPVIV